VELGHPEAAVDRLTVELEHWDPAFRRDYGLCIARLGVAQAKSGDLEAAVVSGQASLDVLKETGSQRTIAQLRTLVELLDTPATRDEAAELKRALIDRDGTTPEMEGPHQWI
jgi:hypothetical protein